MDIDGNLKTKNEEIKQVYFNFYKSILGIEKGIV